MADSSSENPVKHNSIDTLCFQLIFLKKRHTGIISLMIVTSVLEILPLKYKVLS